MTQHPMILRSVLNGAYILDTLSGEYSLGPWITCTYLLKGLNDTYLITTQDGKYVLRVYRTEVLEADVQYEITLLNQLNNHLHSRYTKVAPPVRKKDGSYYSVIHAPEGKRCVVIYPFMPGHECRLENVNDCFHFGCSAAELHLAMDQLELDLPRYELNLDMLVDKPLQRILHHIGNEHAHAAFLKEYVEMIKLRIRDKVEQGLDYGLCHGDMHGNNNVHQDGELFSHYDFEWSSYGWRAYDLAQVLISRRRNQSAEQAEESWKAILKGYRSVREFSAFDEQAVADFITVRRLWVMSLDVHFIDTMDGRLDYSEEWLDAFIQEFRTYVNKIDESLLTSSIEV